MLGRILVFLGGLLVVALFAALLAPFFVNWTDFRSNFELRASRILGQKVTVNGAVEARLIPFPSVTMHDVTVGRGDDGQPLVHVAQFSMDAELAPFLSGEARIFDMRIEQPKINLRLLKDGTLDWLRGSRSDIPARNVVLENVHVTDGELHFIDEQTGRTRIVTGLEAEMSASSLAGPWTVDGHAVLDGEPSRFYLSSLQPNVATGAIPVKTRLMPDNRPFEFELDGDVAVTDGKPGYAGEFVGRWTGLEAEEKESAAASGPRVSGQFELSNERLRVPSYRLELGDTNNPYAVTGEATLDTGSKPEFLLTADGQQIDVSRIGNEGASGKTDRNPSLSVRQRLKKMIDLAASIPIPNVPGRASLSLPAVVAGDTVIRDIQLEVQPAAKGWTIDSAVATFPGRTQLEANGQLTLSGEPSFNGEMLVASTQPTGLASWLSGQVDPALRQIKSLGFSALVDLTPELQRFDKLEVAIGPATLKGRVERQSVGDSEPSLSLDLSGNAVDLDAIRSLGFLIAGEDGGDSLFSHRIGAHLKVDTFSALGVAAENVDTIFTLADGAITLDKLKIGSLAGASIEASGSGAGGLLDYSGSAKLHVSAYDPGALLRILRDRLPDHIALDRLVRNSSWFANSDLSADISFGEQNGGGLSVRVDGSSNGSRIDLHYRLADLLDPDGEMTLDANLANDDTSVLLGQAGLQPLPLPADNQGEIALKVKRTGSGPAETTATFKTDRTSANLTASLDINADGGLTGTGNASLESADIEPYLIMNGIALPQTLSGAPVKGEAAFALDGGTILVSNLKADIAGNSLSGDLNLDISGQGPKATGNLSVARLDLPWLAENVFGLITDPLSGDIGETAFPKPTWSDAEAKLAIKADTFTPGPGQSEISGFSTSLDFNGGILVLDDMAGKWYGGDASGRLTMTNNDGNGFGELRLDVKNGNIATFYGAPNGDAPAKGMFDLTLVAESSGANANDLLSSFNGSGSLALKDLSVGDFNLSLFQPLLAATDKIEGTTIDATVVTPLVQDLLAKSEVAIGNVTIPFNITSGLARMQNVTAATADARMSADARVDVLNHDLDATVNVLLDAGEDALDGAEPAFRLGLKGDVFAPDASLDITDLSNYLSLRAFERERRRVETLQSRVLEKQRLRREVMLYRSNDEARKEAAAREQSLIAEENRQRALAAERADKQRAEDQARRQAEEEAQREAERILQPSVPDDQEPRSTETIPDNARSLPVPQQEKVIRGNKLPPVQLKFDTLPGVN